MRPLTTAQEDLLLGARFGVYLKVEVEKSSSTSAFHDLTDLGGHDWVHGATIRDSIDQLVASADVELMREASTSQSISPLRTDSTLNQDSTGGQSLVVDVSREMKISAATIAASCSPASTDYELLFRGDIDEWDASRSPMTVTARDPGGFLMDRWVEEEQAYGSSSGDAIETVMQSILDDALGSTNIAVETSTSPGFLITPYEQQKQPLLTALQTLADLIGWVVRYRWSTSSTDFTLQFYQPARDTTTPDSTFGPERYQMLPRVSINRQDIRNVVTVKYPDSVSGAVETVTVESSSSIDRYGRQWMAVTEADDSAVDTSSEANDLATAVLDDLKEPALEQSADMHFWWPIEIHDYCRWEDNDVHYNADQDLAVVGWDHQLQKDRHRTMVQLRGQPRSATKRWIERGDPVRIATYRALAQGKNAQAFTGTPSSNNVDGTIVQTFGGTDAADVSWTELRNGQGSTGNWLLTANDTGTELEIGGSAFTYDAGGVDWEWISRAAILFNTETIPANASILSVNMTIYASSTDGGIEDFGSSAAAVICGCSLTDNTNMVSSAGPPPKGYLADYQSFGVTDFSERILFSDLSVTENGPITFLLNGLGQDEINRDGVTSFAMRWSADIDDDPPTLPSTDGTISFTFHSAENGVTGLKPLLSVMYV